MKKRWLVVLGVLAFLGSLLFGMPAALLYAWSHPEKSARNLRLYGVHGTLVDGGFAALTVNNRPALTDARWHLHPGWLALLRLSADLDTGGDALVHLNVSRAVFGKLRLSDLTATGNVKSLLGLAGQPNLPVEGQAEVTMPLLRLDAGIPIEARGNAEIRNLAWTLSKDPLPLGTFSAAVSTDDKGILVSLDSGPGPLEVSGSVTLSRDHAYDLHVQLRPRPDAPPALQSLVKSLGPVDAQGWYQLRRNGTLAPTATATPAAP
jgi:hypothetical protein